MYFKGRLSIDPTQLTKIQKVSPESGFKKLLFGMTGGQFAEKEEVETFKAINILQQIHGTFSAIGIKNIIRLTHDDIDIYYDKNGQKNDMDFAMDKYQIEIDDSMSKFFSSLEMVLEHEDDTFKYLLEIRINKTHKQSEYPIEMVVSGLLKEFSLQPGQSKEDLKAKMQMLFKDQDSYNLFITTKKLAFEQYLESIRFETMKHIRVDDIKMDIKSRMVIQKENKQKQTQQDVQPEYHGMPYGYFGFGDLILYSWLWSELSFDHNIHVSDVELVSEDGGFISTIGEAGIDASDASILDYHTDFDARLEDVGVEDVEIEGVAETDLLDQESGTGWFDGILEDSDFDIDFGDWL